MKAQILYDSIYKKYLKYTNSQIEIDQRLPRAGGKGEKGYCLMGTEFSIWGDKILWK